MYKHLLAAAALSTVLFSGCGDGFETSENGLRYKIHTDNTGKEIQDGDYLTFDMKYSIHIDSLNKDSVLFDTWKDGQTRNLMIMPPTFKGDVNEALKLCKEGDSITFLQNADSLFIKTFGFPVRPAFVPAESDVRFTVKIHKVMTKAQMMEQMQKDQVSQMSKEKAIIKEYLAKNNIKADSTADGLRYTVTYEGYGMKPTAGDTVVVKYTGKLLDGKIFDSSEGRDAIRFPIGQGQVIKGWDEGLLLLNKGAKATFVIPSHLAYGVGGAGNGVIPANATLVFDVNLVDIVRQK